ncbi:MAG TPA: PilX N-terminal domain-containing pilus assembly protein [Acidobacteriota bacterium]|nr:PilX N-terminal domain-containing pilus assembly protein [Acidobacteriota bacterium]
MKSTRLCSQRGFATLIALIMVGMLTLIGLAALSTSDDEVQVASNEMQEMRAFYAAETGLECAAANLQSQYETTGVPPTTMPSGTDSVNHCRVTYMTVDDGPAAQRRLGTGSLAGLHALVKSFTVNSVASSAIERAKLIMTQSFETALVPIFQFAVFYGNDLEIAPGPDMSLIGRVHCNGDMYLQANSLLRMDSYVTASGNILHGRKGPGAVGTGDVQVKDAYGNYVSMQEGAGWLESSDAHWYDSSVARWQGRVQDAAHGQTDLNLPLSTTGGDPHKIIEPGGSNPDSYEHKASLKVIDNKAFQYLAGLWVDVTADMTSKGIITFTSDAFYDQREASWVDATELDIQKLYAEGYAPANGVIYCSEKITGTNDFPALRIQNGSQLGAGLTIASENPVYTEGDFNSVSKQPAAIMGDAVTFLSGSWADGLSTGSKDARVAVSTTVNASIMTGNVETTASDYSGGFENLPRFLETWTGTAFNWSGSMVNLWTSAQADGLWNGTYYSPPIRNWSYDTDLDNPANMPPETPAVRVFQRTGWQQKYVGFDG